MKGIINHKPLGNLYFKEKLDLISLLSLTEQCIDNSESIIIELNQHKQLSEYFKASKVDLVKDTLIFIDYFQEFLNNSRQDVLGVKHMSKLGEEYLNIIGRKNKIGEVNKHSEVIIEAYNLFNQSKVSKMKEYVCSEIKKNLFLSFHLLNGEYELKEKYNALTDMLNKISVGESHGYKDIYELLKEWQVYTDELYNDMNNKFSISAKKLLSLLLKGERVFISANDYSFIKEIEDKMPSLENKVVLEILIKHS